MTISWLASLLVAGAAGSAQTAPEARSCTRPLEAARILDLKSREDRAHLAHDAQSAETIAIEYADVSPARRTGPAQYAGARDGCMRSLFSEIAQTHSVDSQTVRDYTSVRDSGYDALVVLGFGLLYAGAAFLVAGAVLRRQARSSKGETWVALAIASLASALIALLVFDIWATSAESLRLGSWHLSYRVARLPTMHHHLAVFLDAAGLFWLVGLGRHRRLRRTPSAW